MIIMGWEEPDTSDHFFFFFFFFLLVVVIYIGQDLRLSISSFLICRLKVRIEVLSLILPSFIILLKTMGPCVNKEPDSVTYMGQEEEPDLQ